MIDLLHQDWLLAWPWLLLLLPTPALALWLLPTARDSGSAALRIPFAADLQSMAGRDRSHSSVWRLVLAWLAWAFLCLAAARPQQLGEASQSPQSGRDLLLVVDLSGSMAEPDMRLGRQIVDRLTAVKAVLGDFLERRVGDRVGLLLFGQRAYAVTPLTLDRSSVRLQLQDSEVGIAGQETAIGEALALAVKRLRPPRDPAAKPDPATVDPRLPVSEPVVILLTDGVNTAGTITPEKATELAQSAGIRVHTIGFGGSGRAGMFGMRNRSEIDEAGLSAIAEQTGGRYFRARDTNELAGIYAELDRIEPAIRTGLVERPQLERYHWPLALAALLGTLLLVLPRRALT